MSINATSIKLLIFVLIAGTAPGAWSQTKVSSPYSRFGIGDLQDAASTRFFSMAKTGIGMQHPCFINFANPASYAGLDSTSFVFEGGVLSSFNTLKTNKLSQTANYTSLGYLSLAFPLTRFWKSGFGLLPYSNVGYTIAHTETVDSVGKVKYTYEGDGGINQFYWGNSINITRNLSVGANISYLFGNIDKKRGDVFLDTNQLYNFSITNSVYVKGLAYNFGIQYFKKFKKDISLGIGVVFSPSVNVNATRDYLAATYTLSSEGVQTIQDTIESSFDKKGTIVLPQSTGIGFSLHRTDHWTFGADYRLTNWSGYRSFGEVDSLRNSMQFSAGGEFIPNLNSLRSYLDVARYRLGFRYSKSYLQLKNTQLEEFAVTAGIGLPLKRSRSMVNLGVEFGRRGTTAENLIQDNFFRISLGVSIYERWFLRAKFE